VESLVIVGSGCAGATAAIYAARARLDPLVLVGDEGGGQLALTTLVENYPGFADGVMGPELMEVMRRQAERFGARFLDSRLAQVEFRDGEPQRLRLADGKSLEARAVIVATGARPRWLDLPSEVALRTKGVSACATCDGALYRNVPVAVVGGGDTALEEALFLTRFASTVTVIHRRDQFRASKIMQGRVLAHPKVAVAWDSVVDEVLDVAKGEVTGVVLRNVRTGARSTLPCAGLFIAIGHTPNTEVFRGQLALDEAGYVALRDGARSFTSVNGVFVAGDCADHLYRQAVTAAGMGCRAALDAARWLAESGGG